MLVVLLILANMKREEERSAKVDRVTENLQKILDKFHLHFRKIKGDNLI